MRGAFILLSELDVVQRYCTNLGNPRHVAPRPFMHRTRCNAVGHVPIHDPGFVDALTAMLPYSGLMFIASVDRYWRATLTSSKAWEGRLQQSVSQDLERVQQEYSFLTEDVHPGEPLLVDWTKAILRAQSLPWSVDHVQVYSECLVHLNLDHGQTSCSTQLMRACAYRYREAVELLITAGADVNAVYDDGDFGEVAGFYHRNGRTALHFACDRPCPDANPNERNLCGEIVSMLISAGASIDTTDVDGTSPLYIVVTGDNTETARLLISAGAARDSPEILVAAAQFDRVEIARMLLAAGTNPNVVEIDFGGQTPLTVAGSGDSVKMTEMLIAAGAEINKRADVNNQAELTPLMTQVQRGNRDAVARLILAGANLNVQDANGYTPLMFAIKNIKDLECGEHHMDWDGQGDLPPVSDGVISMESIGMIEMLINSGTDLEICDYHGRTAYAIASYYNNRGVMDLLSAAGATQHYG